MSERKPPETIDDAWIEALYAETAAEPPAELDAAVLDMAREHSPAKTARAPWLSPLLASAAVVMLTTSVVLNTPDEVLFEAASDNEAIVAPATPTQLTSEPLTREPLTRETLSIKPQRTLRSAAPVAAVAESEDVAAEAAAESMQWSADMAQELPEPAASMAAPPVEPDVIEEVVVTAAADSMADAVAAQPRERSEEPSPAMAKAARSGAANTNFGGLARAISAEQLTEYRLQNIQCVTTPCPDLVEHKTCPKPFQLPDNATEIDPTAAGVTYQIDSVTWHLSCVDEKWVTKPVEEQ